MLKVIPRKKRKYKHQSQIISIKMGMLKTWRKAMGVYYKSLFCKGSHWLLFLS